VSHKDLFKIVPEGYDVAETDAYISFLLTEYNKLMQKYTALQSAPPQDFSKSRSYYGPAPDDGELRRVNESLGRAEETVRQYKTELEILREKNASLTNNGFSLKKENESLRAEIVSLRQNERPSIESTSRIIAQTIIDIKNSADRIREDAHQEADAIVAAAKAEAERITGETSEKAKKAEELFQESQRQMQEAYRFLSAYEK